MDDTARLLDRFQAAGGNLVDTAEAYSAGRSERGIGEYMRQRGLRPDRVVLTKACGSSKHVRPDYILKAVPKSLDRLQTDHVDLFALYRDDTGVPVGELMDALCQVQLAGLCRAYGVSNWTTERIESAMAYAQCRGLPEPCLSSPHLGLATPNEPMWPECTHATLWDLEWYARIQLPVFGWSAQCRGFSANDSSPDNHANADLARVYHSAENFEKLRRARELARVKNVEPVQVALAWALNQAATTVALVGPSTADRLEVALGALRIALDDKETAWLKMREAK